MSTRQKDYLLKLANVFGALGYTGLLIQWICVFVTIVVPHIQYSRFADFWNDPQQQTNQQLPPTISESGTALIKNSQALNYLLIALIVILVLVGIYYFIRGVGKSAKTVVHTASESVALRVSHVKQIPKNDMHFKSTVEKQTTRISWVLKLLVAILPMIISLIPINKNIPIDQSVVLFGAVILASISLFWFLLQFTVVRLSGLDSSKTW